MSPDTEWQPDLMPVYKTLGETELRLHIFMPPGHAPADARPCIVFFFGGGWTGGKPQQFYPQCAYLASRGMVAISAEYRIRSLHDTAPCESVKDGKSAIRWVRQHARELGIDPGRIAAGGGSAGGQVAAATGTATGFEEADEDRTISYRPNALVLFNPAFNNGPGGAAYARVKDYWREFSPLHNLTAATPPTVIFLGTVDHVLPVATAERCRRIMRQLGARCDLHLYEGQPHGFFNYHRETGNAYYNATLAETDRFLTSLGYLTGEPTLAMPA